ncbi:MAG: glycosyltransferase family 4 protein [Lachnospiraceae bacterium]|nr:glycosyltransferase family 4 protein [Lachnospiraceae bacterium]
MRVFVVGDYRTGTGPANVTKEYLLRFPRDTRRLIFSSKLLRAFEIIFKVPVSSVLLISGYSKQNLLALKWARVWHRPCAYLMHGCVEHENAINECPDETMSGVERKTMELSTAIFAVSRHFAAWLKLNYPEYSDKISPMINGVDTGRIYEAQDHDDGVRDQHMIFTVGGGMPRKKIKHICEAVKVLNDKAGSDVYRLVVIGDTGKDDDEINSYPFVENLGLVDSAEAGRLYDEAGLFIQNSCFETFGLAPMEALVHGCSILVSKEVGALELFEGLEDADIIRNWYDKAEIAFKAEKLLNKGNAKRLIMSFDKESSSWEARTMQLWENLITLTEEARDRRR